MNITLEELRAWCGSDIHAMRDINRLIQSLRFAAIYALTAAGL